MHRLVLAALLVTSVAHAERRTFPTTTTYAFCYTVHECGAGERGGYGPVGTTRECDRYVFRPNGTFTSRDKTGKYRIARGSVRITSRGATTTFALSPDRKTLGHMRRVAMRARTQ